MAQQILVNPSLIRTTARTPEEQILRKITLMFYIILGIQLFGAIVAFLNFQRNSIQLEREKEY
jgi:hypothetical protein